MATRREADQQMAKTARARGVRLARLSCVLVPLGALSGKACGLGESICGDALADGLGEEGDDAGLIEVVGGDADGVGRADEWCDGAGGIAAVA